MEKLLSHTINKKGLNFYRYICCRCFNRHTSVQSQLHNVNTVKKSFIICENGQKYVAGCSGYVSSDNDRKIPFILKRKQKKHFNREHRAFCKLLDRSGYHGVTGLFGSQCRFFTTSNLRFKENDHNRNQDNKDEDDEEDDKDEEDNKEEEDKEDEDDEVDQDLLFQRRIFLFGVVFSLFLLRRKLGTQTYVTWQEFEQDMLTKGEVKNISIKSHPAYGEVAVIRVHPGALINKRTVPKWEYAMRIENTEKFEEKVRNVERAMGLTVGDQVTITYDQNESDVTGTALKFMILVMVIAFFSITAKKAARFTGMNNVSNMLHKTAYTRVDMSPGKKLTFKDVAGLKEAKVEVMEFVEYIKKPKSYTAVGAKLPKGALLLGPPGCGKTLLAKAVAGEANVPFFSIAGSEFVEVFGGLGAKRVRQLFSDARKNKPCIVFIDEIDAIGKKRHDGVNGVSEEEQTLNQILVEMDGVGTEEGVILLASTNRADVLDSALLRKGRFDRHITIELPTMIERLETFEMYLKQLRLEGPISKYAPKLAQMTPGMSGADIANLCNEAALCAASKKQNSVDTDDFNHALERVIAGRAKKSSQVSPSEKKIMAYHEAGHALVGWMLKHTDALLKISIVPRVGNMLGFAQYVPSDQKLYTTEQLFDRMCMALGGRAAESIIFDHVTTGAQDDLQRVTKIAKNTIQLYGMNARVGPLAFPDNEDDEFAIRPYSQALAAIMDEETRALVGKAYRQAETVLLDNKDKLVTLAEALLNKDVLSYEDVTDLIGQPPHGHKHVVDSDIFTAYEVTQNKTKSTNTR